MLVVLSTVFVIGLFYSLSDGRIVSFLPTNVRAAEAGDTISERYFGFYSEDFAARNVAIIRGPFSLDTRLTARLFVVESGTLHHGNWFSVGRSRNQIGSPQWGVLNITLALGEQSSPQGREVCLGCSGHIKGSGDASASLLPQGEVVLSTALPGKIVAGKEYIVYVEGDTTFSVDREMTVEEFAKTNKGNYLLVMVHLSK